MDLSANEIALAEPPSYSSVIKLSQQTIDNNPADRTTTETVNTNANNNNTTRNEHSASNHTHAEISAATGISEPITTNKV